MRRLTLLALAALAFMGAAGPNVAPHAYVIRATTAANALSFLLGGNSQADASAFLCNPTTTVLCVGGPEVDTTTTGSGTPGSGGHCFPICTASTCAASCVAIQAPLSLTYVRVAASTLDAYLLYGGWR